MNVTEIKQRLLCAALAHVGFDGWSQATYEAAVEDSGVDATLAQSICPRGALDLAVAFHKAGDACMIDQVEGAGLAELRYSHRVAALVRIRIECVADKEAARRSCALFALPHHAAEGASLIWGTADGIWNALNDTSQDLNWYTKRTTLSAVYASTILYWLGDDSPDHQDTWAFLDRRIADVIEVEKAKAALKENPVSKPFMRAYDWFATRVTRPSPLPTGELPGIVDPAR